MKKPSIDVKCPECFEVFEDAHRTTCCGQHVCGQCCNKMRNSQCPFCRWPRFSSKSDDYFMDHLLGLQVECRYFKRGCPWTGDLRALKHHVEETCKRVIAICQNCSFECPQHAFAEHVPVCAEATQPCPNRCSGTEVKRKHLKHHLEQECVLRVVASDAVPHAANHSIQVAPLALTMTTYSQYVSTGNTWYSPPFYTHKNGYKVYLKVDADRNMGRSICVCVLKGEYDSTLTWPLYAEMRVSLYNWRTNQPDFRTNLPAWGRGSLGFIVHTSFASDLAEYIQHDCLSFQIEEATILEAPPIPKLPSWADDNCFAVPSLKEKGLSFCGPPVYTHKGGYKLCPRVFPNGFGAGEGIHVGMSCVFIHDEPCLVEADVVLEMLNWRENKNNKRYTVSPTKPIKLTPRVPATANTQYLNADCLLFKVESCTAYLDRASASKLPPWIVMGSPRPCFTVSEFTKRKAVNSEYYSAPFYSHPNGYDGYKMILKVTPSGDHVAIHASLLKGYNDAALDWPLCADVDVELLNWRQNANHQSYRIAFHERVPSDANGPVNAYGHVLDANGRVLVGYAASIGLGKHISCDSLAYNYNANTEFLQDDCLCFRVKVVTYSTALTNKIPRWQVPNTPSCFTITDVTKRIYVPNNVYFSPPFVVAKYKMCLGVSCGGCATGKGTHVTMFACTLKGEDDDTLEWPFCGAMTVEVLNWHGDHDHYKNLLALEMPDRDADRVMTHEELGSPHGNPLFMPLSTLSSKYLEDECMRIRVSNAVCYNTPLRSKTPRWQNWWNTSSRWAFAFTVTHFSSRLEKGSIYCSTPFYTHSKGYKMRLRVKPAGIIIGTMQILAYLMPDGEYDSSLHWPMHVCLTVEIVNWKSNSSHIRKTFQVKSPPMGLPKARCGWGDGYFCSHATVFHETHDIAYVEDDCVHIRVKLS